MVVRKAPVFLLASERSGTNLLRKLVTQHQRSYFGPSPAHFLKNLFLAEPYYGDLSIDDCFRTLVEDAIALCKVHFSPWSIDMEVDETLAAYNASAQPRDVILLSDFLMQRYAESQGFSSYFCKDNDLHEFVYPLLARIPDARFIYLYRDPRDVAVSQMQRTLQTNNLYAIAKLWRDQQIKCISALTRLPERVLPISYEALIADSGAVIRQVCEFIGADYLEQSQEVHIQSGASKEWSNLSAPVMKDNSEKYRKVFSPGQIRLIEGVCWSQMSLLGYQPTGPRQPLSLLSIGREYLVGDAFRRVKLKLTGGDEQDAWAKERGRLLQRIRQRLW